VVIKLGVATFFARDGKIHFKGSPKSTRTFSIYFNFTNVKANVEIFSSFINTRLQNGKG
jgi:hypothetical protein